MPKARCISWMRMRSSSPVMESQHRGVKSARLRAGMGTMNTLPAAGKCVLRGVGAVFLVLCWQTCLRVLPDRDLILHYLSPLFCLPFLRGTVLPSQSEGNCLSWPNTCSHSGLWVSEKAYKRPEYTWGKCQGHGVGGQGTDVSGGLFLRKTYCLANPGSTGFFFSFLLFLRLCF